MKRSIGRIARAAMFAGTLLGAGATARADAIYDVVMTYNYYGGAFMDFAFSMVFADSVGPKSLADLIGEGGLHDLVNESVVIRSGSGPTGSVENLRFVADPADVALTFDPTSPAALRFHANYMVTDAPLSFPGSFAFEYAHTSGFTQDNVFGVMCSWDCDNHDQLLLSASAPPRVTLRNPPADPGDAAAEVPVPATASLMLLGLALMRRGGTGREGGSPGPIGGAARAGTRRWRAIPA